jgi:uncharacterized protein
MKQKDYFKYSLIAIAALLLVIIGIVAFRNNASSSEPMDSSSIPFATGKVVNVGVTGSQYTFSPSEVKKGEKVSLVFDMSQVRGCARSVVIPEYGVRKLVEPNNNIVEFTPTKSGRVDVACSMNMYTGSFMVVE